MKRNNKFLMHWLLVLVLIASAISPSFANAKNTKQQSLQIQSEESDQTVKQLMQKAMEQIEAIPETQSPQKNHKRVEYALFELQAAVDGNFETNNAIKSSRFFDHSSTALNIIEASPQLTSEIQDPIIDNVIAANRLVTKELLSLLEKNQDMFSKKEQKLLEKAQKDYEKGLDFENKNNRGQSIHFYQKSWSNAQVLKDRAKQLLDSDGDGAMDQIEEKLGTDKNAIDTDQDGLLDGYEILKLYTSPLTKDTDKNGTQDSEEDLDQDRLSNLEEQKQGTDPVLKDSDADGLDDHLELKEFGTSPLLKDSDHDGLDDAGEYRVGTDPQEPDSDRDRLYDGLESYPQTFTDKKSGAVLEVTGEGDLSSAVSMQNVSEYTLFQDIPGAVSDFVDVSVEQKVEHATIKFPINKDAIPNGDLEKVKLVVYDKEKHQFTQVENQKIDTKNGVITAEIDRFSVFTLVYTPEWEKSQHAKSASTASSLSYTILNDQDDVDTDGDKLTDLEEESLGTFVYYPDTDGDGLDDGIEADIGSDPFNENIDEDSFNDLEEYEEGKDPHLYDKVWTDYVQEVLLGASVNEFGETLVDWGWMEEDTFNSIPYLIGQLVSGYLVYGDIVDFIANLTQADIGDGLLAAVGVIPVVGDGAKTIAKIVEFVKRAKENLPKALRIAIDEFGDNPKILSALLDEITEGAAKTLRQMGASDRMIAQLGKHGNDLLKISKLKGLKLGDTTLTAAQRNQINRQIRQRWGTNLDASKRAEAFAMEAAIWYYEQLGYKLLYSQRDINQTIRTSQGPDIIMKTPDGEPFIIEAKGSYSEKGKLNDGRRKGARLASNVGGEYRLYLARDWLTVNSQSRYMDAFEKAIQNNTISKEEKEAYDMLKDIINNGSPYKSSVVYGGIRSAKSAIEPGQNLDEYMENLLKDTDSLDFIIIRNI